MSEIWYAVECRPRDEDRASEHARRFGLGAMVPTHSRSVIVNRHTKKRELREFPIVSGLVFVASQRYLTANDAVLLTLPIPPSSTTDATPEVRVWETWESMRVSTRNWRESPIIGIYGSNGEPTTIRQDEIDLMVQHNGMEDKRLQAIFADPQIAWKEKFSVDQVVRINEGPFEGFEGVIVDGLRNRLNVLIHILGRETNLDIGIDHIDAA